MKQILRLALLACTAVGALAFAGSALATPRLIVGGSVVQITEDKSDAAPLKVTIYVASGYSATLTQAAGTQIGTVHADLQALAISPDAIIQADGTVLTDTPAKYVADKCAPGTHAAVWVLHVVVAGTTFDIPVYVDPTAGAEATLGVAKLAFCLSDPYDNAGAARAPFGVKLVNAKMTLNSGVINAPTSAGSYLWRAIVTPWNIATPAPDAAHTVEVQSIVPIPTALSLKATVKTVRHKRGKKTTVTNSVLLSGKLLENLQGVAGAKITILGGGKNRGSTTTNSSGAYSRSLGLPNKTTFQARATVAQRDVTCQSPLPATQVPGGCVGATIAGYTVSSPTVTATPKKK